MTPQTLKKVGPSTLIESPVDTEKGVSILANDTPESKREFLPHEKPDIISILNKEGIDLHRKGRHYWAKCPLHSEKTPSFTVDIDKQRFYCFGCHSSGDSIALIMQLHSLSFKEALNYLGLSNNKPSYNRAQIQKVKEDKALVSTFNKDCKRIANNLYDLLRRLDRLKMKARNMADVEIMATWLHKEPLYEHWITILEGRDEQAKYEVWRGVHYGRI